MKKKLNLKKMDLSHHPLILDKEGVVEATKKLQKQIYDLLYLMFAHNKYSLLIILHGIDAAGKDGTVRHLFDSANPQGMRVYSFKQPTEVESRHDFLWRCHMHTPESGLTSIFNRSYYEEVTTVKVHPELLESQNIPSEFLKSKSFFENRYEYINNFESMLTERGTVVLKFLLHISKDEQKKRIQERLKDRSKNWKFSESDLKARKRWDDYMQVFEEMVEKTSTKASPWLVVPADHKWYRNYLISKTIVERLQKLKMSFPKTKIMAKDFK
jgi:PPK2 family polyphosphate:nucleotide phosphotransferase